MKTIVIGGGPSGMMAAINASQKSEVILLERNDSLGKKLLITGNRRSNITNNKDNNQLVKLIENGRFLYSTFSKYSTKTIVDYFKNNGLQLIEENDNRMFPITEKASSILEVIMHDLEANNVEVRLNSMVTNIIIEQNEVKGVQVNNHQILDCDHLIIATGGITFPKLGSDGNMHRLLKSKNIKVTKLYPSEVAIYSNDEVITSLKLVGLSFDNVEITIKEGKKSLYKTNGPILFTHKGLSGPAILDCGQYVFKSLSKNKQPKLLINFIQSLNQNQFESILKSNLNETLSSIITQYIPKRLSEYIIDYLQLDKNSRVSQISNSKLEVLYNLLFRFEINLSNTDDISHAFVTGGGVDLKAIDSKTFKHKEINNLSICGELLDLHGPIGGYNLTIAILSGIVAGEQI